MQLHPMRCNTLRAITSASGNFCKIEKGGTFTHFGPKKHPHQWVQNCAFMHNDYSNRAYMHGYCSTCINILVFFFLSLFLFGALNSLSLSPHSSWSTSRLPHKELHRSTSHHCRRSTSHHYRRSASNHTPPITLPSISVFLIWSRSNHCSRWTRWSRSNHYCRSTSNHCHTKLDQIAVGQLTDFSLFDQWVSGWVGDDLAFELSGFRPKWVSDLGLIWSRMVF